MFIQYSCDLLLHSNAHSALGRLFSNLQFGNFNAIPYFREDKGNFRQSWDIQLLVSLPDQVGTVDGPDLLPSVKNVLHGGHGLLVVHRHQVGPEVGLVEHQQEQGEDGPERHGEGPRHLGIESIN